MRPKTPVATYRKLKPLFLDTIQSMTGATGDEGTFDSAYGVLKYHVFDDWVAFRLTEFDADFPSKWMGWRHWKHNFHSFAAIQRTDLRDVQIAFTHHLLDFYRDRGYGTLEPAGAPTHANTQA